MLRIAVMIFGFLLVAGSASGQPPASASAPAPEPPPPPHIDQPAPRPQPVPTGPVLSGQRDVFVIADCAATDPILIRILSDKPLVAIRTGVVAPRPAAPTPAWSVEWTKPVASEGVTDEYQSTGRLTGGCPRTGLYSVPLTLYEAGQQSAQLTVTIVREAAPALDVPASVTLATDRLFGAPDPTTIVVRETEPGAPDVRLSVTAGELRSSTGEATGITLEPTNSPLTVRAGQAARIILEPSSAPGPGAYSTKLMLNSPALKQGASVEIAYRVRLSILFLVLMLLLGMALGWWVNLRLAARAALDSSVLSGLRALQAMTRRVTPQRDPAVQQRLLAVANLLQSNLQDAASPAEVDTHIVDAETQAKEIEGRAVESVTALQSALQHARAALRPGGSALDDAVAARLGAPLAELDHLQSAADTGDVEQSTAKLQDFNRDLPGRIAPELQSLLADMQSELGAIGPLPQEDGLEDSRVALKDSVALAYGEPDLPLLIKAADDAARSLRRWMDLTLPAALATQWREAARILNATKPTLAQRLGFAAEQSDQLRRTSRDPLTRLASLAAFRKSVLDALSDAAEGDRAVEAAIKDGDSSRAARLLAKSNEPEPPRKKQPAAPAAPPQTPIAIRAAPASAALRVKPLIQIGQDSLATIRWIGERPAPERVTWHCHPPEAAAIEPTAAGILVRPRAPGFLVLSVDVDGARLAEVRTYAGEVAEQNFYGIAVRERRRTRLLLGLVASLLTGFAGYAILEPGWFGNIGDFARAFLWGCFGQFALDRVRELARPLLSRTIPT